MLPLAVEPTLFGAIAAFSTLLGVSMTILSYISNRHSSAEKATVECHQNLLDEQRRSEALSAELHELRMLHHVREP